MTDDSKPLQDPKTGQFVVGNRGNNGRRKGARNRLHADFIVGLQEHFAEVGKTAIDIVFKESPKEYLKIIASVLPKEFILEDGRLESMGDEELEQYLDEIRRLKSAGAGQGRSDLIEGKKSSLN
ncbi:hypothetical protein [Bradyrhizobium elkanii]|uniref:hypothetical protein n=1 Tax=Bradyrhizobium elkanii TaxID=29448 RepID=UPI00144A02FE|nr:hypothetical protein [Bradyrhizobium elkanii]MCS3577665.1 hypothetical protein [Bradyrhizobium elkanii]MCS3720540.1 hypothetical protein [Bradyrhizobium elkanii]MCS4004957.1 hypothetical protein [Bradyrhizobium elkanii USDA 61]BBC00114.1 hypothetical protein BE61_55680 [Bradyrhizobium elkanii USDA 61]